MWRMGYPNPTDYQDNEGFCGGFGVQWGVNGGKCGVCGDRYDAAVKDHEVEGLLIPNIGIMLRSHF